MKPTMTRSNSVNARPLLNSSTGFADRIVAKLASSINRGTLHILFPNGVQRTVQGLHEATPVADITILNFRALRRLLTHGDMGFADAYLDGDWTTSDLTSLLKFGVSNEQQLDAATSKWSLVKLISRLGHFLNRNSRRQARKNIAYHYDLGNDFYGHWLDSSLTYSAGVFADSEAVSQTCLEETGPNKIGPDQISLQQSQENKYARLAESLRLENNHTVLEIGCGWGGFMEHIIQHYDVSMTGVSISQAQCDFASKRMAKLAGGNKGLVAFKDYRNIEGQFDRIVSIEMFEAVGEKYWNTYAQKLKKLLKNDGVAALQVITISEDRFEHYREQADFIQRYIFPGGMLPTETVLVSVLNEAGLKVTDCFRFGPHYAETLRRWRLNFDAAWPEIHALGFDDRFQRMWHYYLAYCEVGFDCGATDVVQLTVEHA